MCRSSERPSSIRRIAVCKFAPESMVKSCSSGSGPSNVTVAFNSDPASTNAEIVTRSLNDKLKQKNDTWKT